MKEQSSYEGFFEARKDLEAKITDIVEAKINEFDKNVDFIEEVLVGLDFVKNRTHRWLIQREQEALNEVTKREEKIL